MDTPLKLVIGWFTFTCSEDSTILLTEMLNDHFSEWKKLVEFRFFKALKSHNRIDNLDVAFIEGAISSEKQADYLKNIRNNSKYLVAIGACACTGQPSSGRNALIPKDISYKISYYLKNFDYSQNVQKIADFVTVDDQVNGCPMDPKKFLEILNKYLKIFKII
jgi:coenzyme F420-reducing hydrogenase gamma subunit